MQRDISKTTLRSAAKYMKLRKITPRYEKNIEQYQAIYQSSNQKNSFKYESLEIACPSFGWSRLSSLIYVNLDSIIYVITKGPFHWHGITLIPVWLSNYNHYKMWYETYPFQNLNVPTIEVPEWISNFTQHFIVVSWWRHIRCPRPYAK